MSVDEKSNIALPICIGKFSEGKEGIEWNENICPNCDGIDRRCNNYHALSKKKYSQIDAEILDNLSLRKKFAPWYNRNVLNLQ